MTALQRAVQAASEFLSPVLQTETGTPLVQRLGAAIPESWKPPLQIDNDQSKVILYGLELFNNLHIANGSQLGIKDWRTVYALLDIIVVLGLYKCLSPGVGKRTNSILLQNEGRRDLFPEYERKMLLEAIMSQLAKTVKEGGEVGESLQKKYRIDIISGLAELAFNPTFPENEREPWKQRYESFLLTYLHDARLIKNVD
jgi:hypothetical protein